MSAPPRQHDGTTDADEIDEIVRMATPLEQKRAELLALEQLEEQSEALVEQLRQLADRYRAVADGSEGTSASCRPVPLGLVTQSVSLTACVSCCDSRESRYGELESSV